MRTTLLRAGALACALMTSTALTAPALAQSGPPPIHHNADENGVDLVLGTFNFAQTLLTIGPEGPGGLQYVRTRARDRWVDNFAGAFHQSADHFYVSIGNTAESFIHTGGPSLFNPGTFTPQQGTGSTLTRNGATFLYTTAEGVVATFATYIDDNGWLVPGSARLVGIDYPNGTVVGFSYTSQDICETDLSGAEVCTTYYRPFSVFNNFRHLFRFTYAQDTLPATHALPEWRRITSVTGINTSIDPCTEVQCNLTRPWPTVTMTLAGGEELVTLPDNSVWRFTGTDPITAVRAPGSTNPDVAIGYDTSLRVSSITNATGTWTYSYSGTQFSQTTTIQGPLGANRVVTSDPSRQIVLSEQDSLGRTTSFQFDSLTRPTRVTDPEGNYTQVIYDARGNVTESRQVAKPGTGLPDIVASASFPAACANPRTCNQPVSTTNERGQTTDYTYGATHGGIETVTAPAPTGGAVRPQVRYSYTSHSTPSGNAFLLTGISACQTQTSCTGTADETRSTIAYSGPNLLPTTLSVGSGNGALMATTASTYDDIGNLLTVDGPLTGTADTTRYRYDAARRVIGIVGPDPDGPTGNPHRATRFSYDAAGRLTKTETGTVTSQSDAAWSGFISLEAVENIYDGFGRPTQERLTSGGTTYELAQMSYDARGRLECTAVRMNIATFASPPTSACTPSAPGAYGPDMITRSVYDAADQVTQVQTGYTTGDQANEVTATYRSNGLVETITDAEGNKTTFAYDGHDRLSQTRFPSPTTDGVSSATDYEGLTYEVLAGGTRTSGLVVSRRLRDGQTIAYSYDNLSRLTFKNVPNLVQWEYDVHYSYDNLGRLTQALDTQPFGGGMARQYQYDALGRIVSEGLNQYGGVTSQYDLAGRRIRTTWKDGQFVTYDYLVTGEMSAIRQSGALPATVTFGYDSRGRRTSVGRINGANTSYGYDAVSRLTSLAHDLPGTVNDLTLGFTYSPAAQIATNSRSNNAYSFTGHANLSRTDSHNGLNQITSTGGVAVSHDGRGNTSAIGATFYTYTSENRMAFAGTLGMAYDALGHLTYLSNGHQNLAFDQGELRWEHSAITGPSYPITRRFVHGPGVDEPLVWYEGSGLADRRFFLADERGSVIAVTDGAGSLVGDPDQYDEYGRPQSPLTSRFGYTGQLWIPEAGLSYYRARIYNPERGRFMQTDPIGYDGGMNLYAYVNNDPANFIDPLGLEAIIVTAPGLERGFNPFSLLGGGVVASIPVLLRPKQFDNSVPGGPNWPIVTGKRPGRAVPGGRISAPQAACRSCHGIETLPEDRYSTEAENEQLIEVTAILIPWARAASVARAASGIARWLGAGYRGGRTTSGNYWFQSANGQRRVRFDFQPPRQGRWNGPHVQFEVRNARGDFVPAPGTPRHIYFGQ